MLLPRCKIAVYCENRHRREDRERHEKLRNIPPEKTPPKVELSQLAEEVPYKLVEIEGKGRGLVATLGFFKSLFSHLEPDIRAKLMNISCPADSRLKDLDDDQILQMKFEANCIAMAGSGSESVVFEMISMINHSCMPNVIWFPEEADETRKAYRLRWLFRVFLASGYIARYIGLYSQPAR